jgi:plasmid maintenance system antidote protein VapI
MSLSGTLRKVVRESSISDNSLAKALGLSQPTISRFRLGNDIKFSVADKLATYFGLELMPAKPRKANAA